MAANRAVEKLICEVQKHKELYDSTQKSPGTKKRIWESVGASVNMTGPEAAKRWKMVRDAFVKVKRKSGLHQHVKAMKPYKHADAMQFLLPYLQPMRNVRRGKKTLEESGSEESEDLCNQNYNISSNNCAIEDAMTIEHQRTGGDVFNYQKDVSITMQDDEDDIFFRSMATLCKKLPSSLKSSVKFEIHKILYEAEQSSTLQPTPVRLEWSKPVI